MREKINYLIIVILLFFAQSLDAKIYTIEEIAPQYVLTDYLEIFHDKSGETTFEDIKNFSSRFSSHQDWTADFLAEEIYWGKVELTNQLSDGDNYVEWVLHFSLIFTDIKIYVEDTEGQVNNYRIVAESTYRVIFS